MIEIKKENTILKVSKCAYKDIFKNQGYEIIEEKQNKIKETKKEEKEENKKVEEKIVNSSELTEKIDMNVEDNLFPSKETKKGK